MPIAVTRKHTSSQNRVIVNYDLLTFTGNYTPGGVLFNPSKVIAGPGSSPSPVGNVLGFFVFSQLGYTYVLVGQGSTAVLKIFNGLTELGAVAFPEPSLSAKLEYLQFS